MLISSSEQTSDCVPSSRLSWFQYSSFTK
jgi:hypothetical protein